MKKLLFMSTVLLVASNFACADEGSNDGSEICRAQGGVEIRALWSNGTKTQRRPAANVQLKYALTGRQAGSLGSVCHFQKTTAPDNAV